MEELYVWEELQTLQLFREAVDELFQHYQP